MNKKKDTSFTYNLSNYSNNKLPGPQGEGEEDKVMNYISNAFSIQMIPNFVIECGINIHFEEVSDLEEIKEAETVSAVGHPDTAAVISDLLGKEVLPNRISISLGKGDVLYVAQLIGGRLPEGCKSLPEGFQMKFYKVTI